MEVKFNSCVWCGKDEVSIYCIGGDGISIPFKRDFSYKQYLIMCLGCTAYTQCGFSRYPSVQEVADIWNSKNDKVNIYKERMKEANELEKKAQEIRKQANKYLS